jgi:hypothetical protein
MSSRHLAELGFVLIGLCAVWLELSARRGRRRGLPPNERSVGLGEALASAMTTRTGKVLVLGWWWFLGWHFLAR